MPFKDRPFFRRILELDDRLRRKKPVTCGNLAARWETSAKTVQRLVEQMREEFSAPIAFDRKRNSYVYTDDAFRLPWLPIEGKDLFAIGVAMKVLQIYEGTPAAKDLTGIFERLSQLMPGEVRVRPSSLIERLYVHPQPFRPIDPAIWEAVAQTLREKTELEIGYRKPGSEPEPRRIEPYCLVFASGDWLLAARDPEDDRVKTFYLNRIVEAKPTGRRFALPKGFDPDAYFGESLGIFAGGTPFRFRVRFDKEIAPWVAEVRWHDKQKLRWLSGGTVELELPTESMWEARRFVLSFGRFARALSPAELVEEMKKETREMRRIYG
jgi:predicted DNA-binding transcriptional regulator YafY